MIGSNVAFTQFVVNKLKHIKAQVWSFKTFPLMDLLAGLGLNPPRNVSLVCSSLFSNGMNK